MKKESLGLRLGDCSEDRTKYKSLCKCPSIKSKCKKRVIVGISKDIFCRKSELCFFGLENGHLDVLTISKGSDLLDLDIVDHPRDGIVSKMRSIRDMVDSSYEVAAALVRELEGKSRPFDEARVLVKYYLRMLFDHTRSGDPLGRCIEVNVELWSHRYRLDLYFGILKNESQKKIAIYGEVWWNIYMIPTSKLQEILDTADGLPDRFKFTNEQKQEIMQMFESIESEEDKVKYLEYFYDYISRSCDGIKLASRLTIRDEIIEVEKQEKLVELNSNLF